MKLTIESRGVGESWGHVWHNVSQAYSRGGDVIVTFGNQGSITFSSEDFDYWKNNAIFYCSDELKQNVDTFGNIDTDNMQRNDAILNNKFMEIVDARYEVCNIGYRLSGKYC